MNKNYRDAWSRLAGRLNSTTQRMTIAVRMGFAFGLVLSLFAGTTAFAVWQMSAMTRDMDSALQASTEIAGRAGKLRQHIDGIFNNAILLVLAAQKDDLKFHEAEIGKARADYLNVKQELAALTGGGKDLPGLPPALQKLSDAESALSEVDQTINRRKAAAATVADEDAPLELENALVAHFAANVRTKFEFWVRAVDTVVDLTSAASRERHARAQATAALARNVQIGASAVALLIGVFAAWMIARNVSRPIRRAVEVAERVAQGELSVPIERGGSDETGALLDALARMQSSLHGLVSEVRDSAQSIETASSEVAAGNADLSQRTEHAASQLQRTASSVEQLSEAVRQSAQSARMADALARSAASEAERGGTVVLQVVQSMETIAAQSRRIADIIGVIDGIAFQTNILALNAAVEAARAGEQGRGFAVVAGEVRGLAQRSAEAAKDIKLLIGASVESVDAGSRLVRDAGQTMQGIVGSVRKVTTAIEEISEASASQSHGIGQVSEAMGDIDRMTQQNAALVEQGAAAAESLKSQALRLTSLVDTFRLGEAGDPTGIPAESPR